MTRSVMAGVVVSVIAARGSAQSAQSAQSAVERELFRLEETFAQSVVKRDAAALRQLVAPGWVYSDESGVMQREEGIKAFTSGTDTVRSAGNDRMRAMVYGNTAIVIGE